MQTPEAKRDYHHGNLRHTILETSLKLIEKNGVEALTLREIGRLAGVSRMAAYRHFAGKRALLGAISEAGFTQFTVALQQARDAAGPGFADRLPALGAAYARFASEHPAHYEVMFNWAALPGEDKDTEAADGDNAGDSPCAEPDWRVPARRSFDVLAGVIADGQREGLVRAGEVVALAQIVWATVHGMAMLKLEDRGGNLAETCNAVLRRGLSPEPWL